MEVTLRWPARHCPFSLQCRQRVLASPSCLKLLMETTRSGHGLATCLERDTRLSLLWSSQVLPFFPVRRYSSRLRVSTGSGDGPHLGLGACLCKARRAQAPNRISPATNVTDFSLFLLTNLKLTRLKQLALRNVSCGGEFSIRGRMYRET